MERARGTMRIGRLLVGGGFGATLVSLILLKVTRVEVAGDSMRPTLDPGDRLVVRRTQRPLPGHVVALRDPRDPSRVIVKRAAVLADDGVVVLGDDPGASTDSRTFGPVSRALIIGVAEYRYAPPERATRLRRGPVPCIEWPPTGSTPSSLPTTSPGCPHCRS